jgi:hypothetical protein
MPWMIPQAKATEGGDTQGPWESSSKHGRMERECGLLPCASGGE